ncbi:MAG: glycosyltransferase family 39 protein [Acidimicrobiales bacterium]
MDLVAVRAAETTSETREAPPGVGRLSRCELLVVVALTAASVVANFFDLGSRSLWLDEIHSALIAVHHGTSLWSGITADGGNMLVYYGLLPGFVSVLGDGQFALRAPSALVGAGLTPVTFFLGRRMFGTRSAVIAASIVAVSPALVVWNQQARGYGFGTLLIALSLLALFRAIESPNRRRWCVYGLLVVCSIYTIAYAAMFFAAQWLAIAFWPRPLRPTKPMLAVVGVAALAYVPLTVLMLRSGAAGVLRTNPAPSTSEGIHLLEELTLGVAPDFVAVTLISAIVTVVGLLSWIAASAELVSRVRSAPGEPETACLGIALSWLLVPLLCDAVFSLAHSSIFNSSFLLQSVPAGALVVAFVIGELLPGGLSQAFAVGFISLLLAALLPTYGVSFEQWAQASRYIRTASQPGDCLTVNKAELASNLAYYFSVEGGASEAPRLVLPALTWSDALAGTYRDAAPRESLATVASSCRRLWIVVNRASPGQFVLINSEVS